MPESAAIKPATMRRSVVLPTPLAPTRAASIPGSSDEIDIVEDGLLLPRLRHSADEEPIGSSERSEQSVLRSRAGTP